MREWIKTLTLFLILFAAGSIRAQDETVRKGAFEIQPVIGLQLWAAYTQGAELYDPEAMMFFPVDDRLNFQLRRSRLGVKGHYGQRMKFNLTAAIDLLGRDALAGTEGGVNNGGFPLLRIWNAWVQWRAFEGSELMHVTFGFHPPRIGRESMTPALKSPGMEKAWSQNYLRRHLVGTGPGRSVGLNAGGLIPMAEQLVIDYELGLYNPVLDVAGSITAGAVSGPLIVSRMALSIGEPEHKKYTLSKSSNFMGQRRGITLAAAAAYNKGQELYQDNLAYGFDFLFNWDQINIDGDMTWLRRTERISQQNVNATTGYARISFYQEIKNNMALMPAITYSWYDGETEMREQQAGSNIGMPTGFEDMLEVSAHWFIQSNYRLTLAYTFRSADGGELGGQAGVNNHFSQRGLEPIKRGDWFGLGVIATF